MCLSTSAESSESPCLPPHHQPSQPFFTATPCIPWIFRLPTLGGNSRMDRSPASGRSSRSPRPSRLAESSIPLWARHSVSASCHVSYAMLANTQNSQEYIHPTQLGRLCGRRQRASRLALRPAAVDDQRCSGTQGVCGHSSRWRRYHWGASVQVLEER